jgi:acyl-CoA thioesterase I
VFFLFVALVAFIATLGLYYSVDDKKQISDYSMNSSKPGNSENNNIRFMPIGDSYTIGNGVRVSERWPNLLVESLMKEGIVLELIANPAVSGYDAEDAIVRELPLFEKEKPDFGTLFIGANDSFRGRNLETFRNNYVELLDRMQISLTNKDNLVVITIPNYANFPQVRGYDVGVEEIEGYNQIIREEAGRRNLPIVDLYSINTLGSDDYFISDGIHPSPKGIKVWHDVIFPVVREVLKDE